ncbi:MAG TPA: CU044_2847 family protein [Thermoanaerobaculia bacterium]
MKVIQVQTESGRTVHVEVDEAPEVVAAQVAGGEIAGGGERILQDLQEVALTIADVCRTIQERAVAAMEKVKPSELTLEFGIKLAGETGIPLVTKGSVEGTFQVTAKWDFTK